MHENLTIKLCEHYIFHCLNLKSPIVYLLLTMYSFIQAISPRTSNNPKNLINIHETFPLSWNAHGDTLLPSISVQRDSLFHTHPHFQSNQLIFQVIVRCHNLLHFTKAVQFEFNKSIHMYMYFNQSTHSAHHIKNNIRNISYINERLTNNRLACILYIPNNSPTYNLLWKNIYPTDREPARSSLGERKQYEIPIGGNLKYCSTYIHTLSRIPSRIPSPQYGEGAVLKIINEVCMGV